MKIKARSFIYALCTLVAFVSSSAFAVQLSLGQYQELTKNNSGRCNGGIKANECAEEIAYAVAEGMIDAATGNWAKANNYYPTFISRGSKIGGVCQCGCFAAGTSVLTGSGWQDVSEITKGSFVTSYEEESNLSRPDFSERVVKSAISGPEKAPLFVFSTQSGHSISVTQHHGMVLASGRMKAARDVRLGDLFVTVEGKPTAVTAIKRVSTDKPVYNLEVSSPVAGDHIIAAQGLLVGDLVWQNNLKKELSSIQLRK